MNTNTMTAPLVQTFMTHRMSDEAIEMLATGRDDEKNRIIDAVERSLKAAPGSLQHVVIYGPRGFGKSFIARLVQIETAKLAQRRGLTIPFILLPEEQHNLTRNPHALLAYITHKLADERTGQDRSWAEAMFQWPDPDKQVQQWREAEKTLEHELDITWPERQGLAIVVIENFDSLLASVFKDETAEQRLRKWLDRQQNRVMLIATATGSVDMDYDRPLFQAFQSVRLAPWQQDTCIAYFNRRRLAEGKPELDAIMEAKARAVSDFIGGNPRLAQLLADVLDTEDALSVADTMKALADKLADYYRRRIDDLPPLAQGLLDALIRGGEPASQTVLAERVGAPAQSTIARVMQDLLRSDIILGLPAVDSRETLYRVTDRVFVHFYRLRQGNELALKTPLATILEFLRAFYSRDEQKAQAANHLAAGRPNEARLFADLAREGEPFSSRFNRYFHYFGERLQRYLDATGEILPLKIPDIVQKLNTCPEQLITQIAHWDSASAMQQTLIAIIHAQALARLSLLEQADEKLTQQLAVSSSPASQLMLHYERGSLLWSMTNNDSLAIDEYKAAGELRLAELPLALKAMAYRSFAWVLCMLNQHDEAIANAQQAANLAAQVGDSAEQAIALCYAAWSLGQLNRYDEAIASAQEAANLAAQVGNSADQAQALRHAAWSLVQLNRHDEAIASAQEAANLAAQVGNRAEQAIALRHAAWSLGQLNRHDEAIARAQQAANLATQIGDSAGQAQALRIAAYSLNQLNRHQEALTQALTSMALAQKIVDMWNIKWSTKEAILAAIHTPSPDAITAFATWVEQDYKQTPNSNDPDWRQWLGEAFAASARARFWSVWDNLIASYPESLKEHYYFSTTKIGLAIALRGQYEGRAEGFEAMREALPRLVRFWQITNATYDDQRDDLTSLVAGFAEHCHDPGLLRDVSDLLNADLTTEAPKQASLLLTLAQFDEAKKPAAVLARMDPDIAIWLKRIRKLPEISEKPKRRKK